MVSGKKQVVWFHACFPASPAASQAACFYFSSIRTGLSCLESFKNLCSLDAHWQNSLTKAILSKTNTLENIFFKTIFFLSQNQYLSNTSTKQKHSENLPVEHFTQCSVFQEHFGLGQSFGKALFVFSAH